MHFAFIDLFDNIAKRIFDWILVEIEAELEHLLSQSHLPAQNILRDFLQTSSN